MSTKDPHIALIDAHERLERVKLYVKQAVWQLQAKKARGEPLSEDDRDMIRRIRQTAIERSKRIQDELAIELESHGVG